LVQVEVHTPLELGALNIALQRVWGVEQLRPRAQNSMQTPAFGGARSGRATQRSEPWLEVRVVSHCTVTSTVMHAAPDSRSAVEQMPEAALEVLAVPTKT
jgi:hypothetical protein